MPGRTGTTLSPNQSSYGPSARAVMERAHDMRRPIPGQAMTLVQHSFRESICYSLAQEDKSMRKSFCVAVLGLLLVLAARSAYAQEFEMDKAPGARARRPPMTMEGG